MNVSFSKLGHISSRLKIDNEIYRFETDRYKLAIDNKIFWLETDKTPFNNVARQAFSDGTLYKGEPDGFFEAYIKHEIMGVIKDNFEVIL